MSGCKKSDNPVGPDLGGNSINIKTGASIDAISQTVSTAGGSVIYNKSGDPLSGLEIDIAPNSFTSNVNIQISYSPITSHNFGQHFNPITPLIKIKSNFSNSDNLIRIKVPISLPQGSFAMGFAYDETTGKIEGLPIEDLGTNYVVVDTRSLTSNSSLSKGSNYNDVGAVENLVICSAFESIINNQTILSTGFSPGVDDWEFINWGSYISPMGHCAGQSLSAIWYYMEKKLKGSKSLFHAYDNLCQNTFPNFMWMDNPQGYRFSSSVQEDFKWDSFRISPIVKSLFGKLNWYAFILSMMNTGEPQLVELYTPSSNEGHAMIVYKIDVQNGILYVADPNYPNNRDLKGNETIRMINYSNGQFSPYSSAVNAGAAGLNFTLIQYFGKRSLINWSQVGNRFTEFENGIVGNDRFPAYELFINSTNGLPLQNNYYSSSNQMNIVCKSSACETSISGTDHLQQFLVYSSLGGKIAEATSSSSGIATINLRNGKNHLGFYIMGMKATGSYYVDFKWLDINYNVLYVNPASLKGIPNTDYTFYAITYKSIPSSAKLVWNFGDNTPEVTKLNDTTIVHKFQYDGTYTVSVKLTDNSTGTLIGSAYSTATISSNYSTLFIDPEHLYGQPNTAYQFKARTDKDLPPNVKFVWDFGDGSPEITKINDTTVTYTYTSTTNRDYNIFVQMYDNSTNTYIKSAYATVTIASGTLATIKNSAWVGLDFIGDFTFSGAWSNNLSLAQYLNLQSNQYTFTWTGNKFVFSYSVTKSGYFEFGDTGIITGQLQGEVSSDGTTILSANGYQYISNPTNTDSIIYKIDLNNLQYNSTLGNTVDYQASGPSVATRINSVDIRRKTWNDTYHQWSTIYLKSINYNSYDTAFLTITFFAQ